MVRTKQEHVDDLTMRLEHKDKLVGSGFIDYGPQVPFQGRVIVQPTTIQHDDVPDWFDHGRGGHHNHRGGHHYQQQHSYQHQGGRGGGHQRYGTGHGYQAAGHHQPGRGRGGHHHVQGHHQTQQYRQPVPITHPHQQHLKPAPVPPSHRPTTPGVFDTTTLMQALQPTAGQHPIAPAAPTPAQPQAPQSLPDTGSEQDKKLSKAQKAKLRKKMREGKA